MRKITLFLSLALVFISCGDNQNDPYDEVNIEIEVKYSTSDHPEILVFDTGAKIFIYYDFYTLDIADYIYETGGKLIKGDSVILPSQTGITNEDGNAVIRPENENINKKITIIVESNYYIGKTALNSYSSSLNGIKQQNIFNP